MLSPESIAQNYAAVENRLLDALKKSGRKRDAVTLIAVSKFQPAAALEVAAGLGQADFGENYAQEAELKRGELDPRFPSLRWHMIGHLQSRKTPLVAGRYALVHTLDSIKLADAFEKRLEALDLAQDVLIEVNLGKESQKAGVNPEALDELVARVLENCPRLKLRGFTCLPPVFDEPERARPYFAKLRETRDRLEKDFGVNLPDLSMGMSGDFEAAIEEGATFVRVGTAIFGPRPAKRAD